MRYIARMMIETRLKTIREVKVMIENRFRWCNVYKISRVKEDEKDEKKGDNKNEL